MNGTSKTYMIVFNGRFGSRNDVTRLMNVMDVSWRSDLPNVFYFKTSDSLEAVMGKIEKWAPKDSWFLLIEIDIERVDGFQSWEAWDFIKDQSRELASAPA